MRRRAIRRLEYSRKNWVLDSGSGPGVSSRMLLEDGFERVIGLDPSVTLLRTTKTKLSGNFFPVLGVAENLPLRSRSIAGAITCYSLRDVRNNADSISEFARVVDKDGRLEIVDVGKPDNPLFRGLIGLYIVIAMPIMSRFLIGRRGRTNPFRMIVPTFRDLPTNQTLTRLADRLFGPSILHKFLFGGLVIIEANHAPNR